MLNKASGSERILNLEGIPSSCCPASGGIYDSIINLQSFRAGELNSFDEGAYDNNKHAHVYSYHPDTYEPFSKGKQ
jgi:hypothetical protein